MDWFLYDNGLRHERVKKRIGLGIRFLVFLNISDQKIQETFTDFSALILPKQPFADVLQNKCS